ncbi:MAG: hypothetical protein ACP5I1_10090 [Candidatus Hinthialibacter sp.]
MNQNIIQTLFYFSLFLYVSCAAVSDNSYNWIIPEGTAVAGVFQEGRSLTEEWNYLSMIYFVPGVHTISLSPGTHALDLIERFEFGPERRIAAPLDDGVVKVEISNHASSNARFRFEQDFDIDGTKISLFIDNIYCTLIDGKPENEALIFDEPYLSQKLYMLGQMQTDLKIQFLKFASLDYTSLPLYRLALSLEGGQSIQLFQRWQPPFSGTGPANLVFSLINIDEGIFIQSDYWKLVYSAEHHNWNEKYWTLFDPPLGETYGLAVITEDFPSRAEVYTLDQNLEPKRWIEVVSFHKGIYEGPFPPVPSALPEILWELY